MFQVRDPGYSTVWKSKSSSCLQDTQQAWSSLHTCAVGPPHGPSKDSQHLPAAPQNRDLRDPSSPATEFCPTDPLKSGHRNQTICGEQPTGLDTNGCWVGRINQPCFHFKTLQLLPPVGTGHKSGCHTWENQPHTWDLFKSSRQQMFSHTLPICCHGVWDEDKSMTGCPWCGLSSSGDSGTNQVIWSRSA